MWRARRDEQDDERRRSSYLEKFAVNEERCEDVVSAGGMIQPKDPEELRLLEEEPGLQPKVEQPQAPPPTPSFLQLPKELLSGVSHSACLLYTSPSPRD